MRYNIKIINAKKKILITYLLELDQVRNVNYQRQFVEGVLVHKYHIIDLDTSLSKKTSQ
jgi:hypothetical protein